LKDRVKGLDDDDSEDDVPLAQLAQWRRVADEAGPSLAPSSGCARWGFVAAGAVRGDTHTFMTGGTVGGGAKAGWWAGGRAVLSGRGGGDGGARRAVVAVAGPETGAGGGAEPGAGGGADPKRAAPKTLAAPTTTTKPWRAVVAVTGPGPRGSRPPPLGGDAERRSNVNAGPATTINATTNAAAGASAATFRSKGLASKKPTAGRVVAGPGDSGGIDGCSNDSDDGVTLGDMKRSYKSRPAPLCNAKRRSNVNAGAATITSNAAAAAATAAAATAATAPAAAAAAAFVKSLPPRTTAAAAWAAAADAAAAF